LEVEVAGKVAGKHAAQAWFIDKVGKTTAQHGRNG